MHKIPVSLLFRKYRVVAQVLAGLYGERAAAMILQGLRLQSYHGACFASAAYLGKPSADELHRKQRAIWGGDDPWSDGGETLESRHRWRAKAAWLRLARRLRAEGMIRERRRIRVGGKLGGTQGTNITDFRPLWQVVARILAQILADVPSWQRRPRVEIVGVRGDQLIARVGGIYYAADISPGAT